MMEVLFYTAAMIALVATIAALTRPNAAHALIYLIVSLLAVAVMFFPDGRALRRRAGNRDLRRRHHGAVRICHHDA